MSYQTIEQDDAADKPQGLEFKSFLGPEATTEGGVASSATRSGYRREQPVATSFWQIEHYQHYFDVDTSTVLKRCYTTLNPLAATEYISTQLQPQPDLYGPFWTLTTVIFSLFVFSGLASSVTAYLSNKQPEYDFQLLSIAVGLVYSYGLGLPVLLWLALRYLGVNEWSIVEAVSIFGYGQFVWIPVSLLCVFPSRILRIALSGAAFGLSGWFLVATIYPILATAEAKSARLLVIIIAALHLGLAVTFKVLFFSYYVVPSLDNVEIPGIDTPSGGANSTRLFF